MTFTQEEIDAIRLAAVFQMAAHSAVKQKRKYTGTPYHFHPYEVALTLLQYCPRDLLTVEMVQAALLHDTVEDTGISIKLIEQIFGLVVANLVDGLSDPEPTEGENRIYRTERNREHIISQGWQVITIKCCDLYRNTKDIVQQDKHFAQVYLPEKRKILESIPDVTKEKVPQAVWDLAWNTLIESERLLERYNLDVGLIKLQLKEAGDTDKVARTKAREYVDFFAGLEIKA